MQLLLMGVMIWAFMGVLLWQHTAQKEAWSRQISRYSLLSLVVASEAKVPLWQRWVWYQNLQTFVNPKQLQKGQSLIVLAVVIAPLVLIFNGMDWYVAVLLTTISIVMVTWFSFLQLQQKAMVHFRDELPDVIDGLIRALRVGAPIVDVFQEMANQYQGVTSRLFTRMHDELKVGQTLSEVMKNAAQSMPIAEFRFLTIVLSLQQETGGRLTKVLERLGETLRSRAELNASIQTITSESRSSAKVLAALPILVCLVLFTSGREHFDFLMTSNGGQLVMAYVVGSVLFGLFLIRRMTQLKG